MDSNVYIPVFDKLYNVTVPEIALYIEDDISEYGLRSTGIKELDDSKNMLLTSPFLSIAKMTIISDSGYDIRIKHKDVLDIYTLIMEHLTTWKDYISNSINLNNAPTEDLIRMDEFAYKIHGHAKYKIGRPTEELSIGKMTFGTGIKRINRMNHMEPEDLEHNSFGEFFMSREPRNS